MKRDRHNRIIKPWRARMVIAGLIVLVCYGVVDAIEKYHIDPIWITIVALVAALIGLLCLLTRRERDDPNGDFRR